MKNEIMDTEEIEKYIIARLKNSKYFDELLTLLRNIYRFTDILSYPGTYIYSNGEVYYQFSVGDRGKKTLDRETKKIEELVFNVCEILAFNLSLKIADKNKKQDYRRELFKWELYILSTIDPQLEKLGKKRINKILSETPYDDSVY